MAVPVSHPLRVLRIASLTEGATLLLLLLVAVPLKRMADLPMAVSIVGPLHGAAFLVYSTLVLQALFTRLISTAEAARLVVAAFIPFGAWMVAGMLRRPRPAGCVPVSMRPMRCRRGWRGATCASPAWSQPCRR